MQLNPADHNGYLKCPMAPEMPSTCSTGRFEKGDFVEAHLHQHDRFSLFMSHSKRVSAHSNLICLETKCDYLLISEGHNSFCFTNHLFFAYRPSAVMGK